MLIKKLGKSLICTLLEGQVKRLRARNDFKVVAVAGSVGKTSTKLAISTTLGGSLRVVSQDGNYNDRVTVPLVLFGRTEPNIFNMFAWIRILLQNETAIRRPYLYDVAVLEIGTDGPGQMKHFAYLRPELVVLTAISPEHMEYFKTMDAVAAEELTVFEYAPQVLVNIDDIPEQFMPNKPLVSYSMKGPADYAIVERQANVILEQRLKIVTPANPNFEIGTSLLGEQGAKIALAAVATAIILGVEQDKIIAGVSQIRPAPGRLQVLPGLHGSILLDDTYNASPIAVTAALDVLYAAPATSKIAILGSMNEMGKDSAAMHRQVGAYCDPSKLELVATIGKDANDYLAPAAEANGCKVMSFEHPRLAGEYLKPRLKTGMLVLAKGSQNGVYAEEALIPLLANPEDSKLLVRQSEAWKATKLATLPTLD